MNTAGLGLLDLVSAADAPYALAVHLPTVMTADQSYAIWALSTDGNWSAPVLINDARPLWITPDSAYQTASLANLPTGATNFNATHSTLVLDGNPVTGQVFTTNFTDTSVAGSIGPNAISVNAHAQTFISPVRDGLRRKGSPPVPSGLT